MGVASGLAVAGRDGARRHVEGYGPRWELAVQIIGIRRWGPQRIKSSQEGDASRAYVVDPRVGVVAIGDGITSPGEGRCHFLEVVNGVV